MLLVGTQPGGDDRGRDGRAGPGLQAVEQVERLVLQSAVGGGGPPGRLPPRRRTGRHQPHDCIRVDEALGDVADLLNGEPPGRQGSDVLDDVRFVEPR